MMHKMAGRGFDTMISGAVVVAAFPGRKVGLWCRTGAAKCGRTVAVQVELDDRLVRPKMNGDEIGPRWADCDCPDCLELKCKTAT